MVTLQCGITSPGTLAPCKCCLPFPLLLLPPLSGSFLVLLGQTSSPWELLPCVVFSVAKTAAGDTSYVPGSPSCNSDSGLGLRFVSLFFFFSSSPLLQSSTFASSSSAHLASACVKKPFLNVVTKKACLLENEKPNKAVLEHHLMEKNVYWLGTRFSLRKTRSSALTGKHAKSRHFFLLLLFVSIWTPQCSL